MKKFMYLYIVCLFFLTHSNFAHWTSVYHKKIATQDIERAKQKNMYIFTKENVPLFSQLLFSWNVLRPDAGYFSFYVQARDAHTHQWGTWHKMIDWGRVIQKSYNSKSDGICKYEHVRLETEPFRLADAFRIKVTSNKGAPMDLLKGLAVSIANLHEFVPEKWGAHIEQLTSIIIPNVPRLSQMVLNIDENNRVCSPTSCSMLTGYLTKNEVCPIEFAKKSYDRGLDTFGSWPFNLAHAFEKCNGKNWFFNTRLNSFTDLYKQLKRGLPVVVSVRGHLPGAPQSFPNGHLLVVIGWDAKQKAVICHDPSCKTNDAVLVKYKFEDFVKAWDRSRRLCYWVEPVT